MSTTSSSNFTTLYSPTGTVVPTAGYGNANVVSLLAVGTDGANTITNISATGNIYAQNIFANIVGNLNVPGNTGEVVFNSSAQACTSPNLSFNTGTAILSVTGNIVGNYILGNGSQLTGLSATYGNANVVANLAALGSNPVSTTGNITAGYFVGNGSLLTGIVSSTYGNAQVAAFLGNLGSNVVSTTGNITASYYSGNGSQLTGVVATSIGTLTNLSVTGNTQSGNLLTGGIVSAAGNITGAYISGNGSLLTNLTGGNVTGTVANATYALNAGTASTANLAQFVTGNAQSNITSVGILSSLSVSGNTQSGNLLTVGLISATGTITSAATITGGNIATGGTVSATGNITGANLTITRDAVIQGNLTVNGNTTFINSNTVTINDKFINVANNAASAAAANGGGLGVGPVGAEYASLTYNSTSNSWNTSIAISATGNVGGNFFIGNGSQLTGVVATGVGTLTSLSVTGNTQTGNLLTGGLVSATGNITGAYISGNGSLLTNITGGNVTGTVANATYATTAGSATTATTAGTVTANAQANITSVGVLTSLSVSGNTQSGNILTAGVVSATGNISGNYYIGNGSLLTGIVGTYANANVANFLANFGSNTVSTTGNITSGNFITSGLVSATGNVTGGNVSTGNVNSGNLRTSGIVSATGNITTAAYFIGDGSQLTGITTTYGNANVATFLAAFGSNTISTTGTITSGNMQGGNLITTGVITATGNIAGNYFIGNGSLLTGISGSGSYSNANATSLLANFGSNTIVTTGNVSFGNITATGMITTGASGNVSNVNYLLANVVSATGNISGNYFIGNGSQLTGISAGGSPGGANTQIQYNNASAFAGNANLTFNNSTGNVNLGNLIFTTSNATNWINTVAINTGVPANVFSLNSSQIVIGNTWNGNANLNNQGFNPARGAKLQVWDTVTISDSGGPRYAGITSTPYAILAGNISNNNSTLRAAGALMTVGGNSSNYTYNVNGLFGIVGGTFAATIGQPNTTVAVGNITVGNVSGLTTSLTVNLGSNANNSMQMVSAGTYNGNTIGNVAGLVFNLASNSPNTISNVFGVYMTGNNTSGGGSTGMFGGALNNDGIRNAANYYFLYNNDTLAQNKIGSLSSFNEFRYDGANTSGTLAVDKNNGQVQNVYLTGAITSVTFSNFVTSAATNTTTKYQTDTVTIILHQGSTPYAVTMPTGTAYRYAGGANTVGATANAVTMISVTATYDSVTSADQYLITISPEFT